MPDELADQHLTPPEWSEPAGLNPRGTVLVIPGRGEQPAVYERLARRISADAYRIRVLHDPTSDAAITLAQVTGRHRPRGVLLMIGSTGNSVSHIDWLDSPLWRDSALPDRCSSGPAGGI
jgi:hypothetical protein